MQLVLPALEDGTNVKGNINLPNWGNLALGLGNLTLNVLSGHMPVGIVYIYNVTMYPGNNSYPFHGQLFLKDAIANIGALLDSQSEPLSRGSIRLGTTGNATMINGEHINFIEKVLNNKYIYSEMPVMTLLAQVLGGLLNGDGNGPGLTEIISDLVGNKTFVEDVVNKLNSSGIVNELNSTLGDTKRLVKPKKAKASSLAVMLKLFKARQKLRKH